MTAYNCDDRALELALKRLESLVQGQGGWLADAVTVQSSDGFMGIYSSLPNFSKDPIIKIPESCFLPFKDVQLKLSGNDICMDSHADNVPAHKLEQMEVMLEIYNRTDKIAKHRAASPRYVFKSDPVIFDALPVGRAGTEIFQRFENVRNADDLDEIILTNFLRTRRFDYEKGVFQIIPFIDFCNHHSMTQPVARHQDDTGRWWFTLPVQKAVAGTDECFANYGFYDAYDTYLMFGFVGPPLGFVRSVPLTLNLPGLAEIKVNAELPVNVGSPPPELQNLQMFYPRIIRQDDAHLELSHLIIPGPFAPYSLRRILTALIAGLDAQPDSARTESFVRQAETQLVDGNIEFFQHLKAVFDSRAGAYADEPAFAIAQTMLDIQLAALQTYRRMD